MASPNAPGRSSVQVPTSPDMVFEDLEFFRCVLVIPPMDTDNVVKGEPDMARVNITDNTGAYVFVYVLYGPVYTIHTYVRTYIRICIHTYVHMYPSHRIL